MKATQPAKAKKPSVVVKDLKTKKNPKGGGKGAVTITIKPSVLQKF